MMPEKLPSSTINYFFKVDIPALQQTRLLAKATSNKRTLHFFDIASLLTNSGFAVKNTLLQLVEVGFNDSKCINILCLHTNKESATFVSVYAHTLYADDKVNDAFYKILNFTLFLRICIHF